MIPRLPFLSKHLRPYRLALAGLGLLMLGASVTEGAGIGLFYPLLEYIQHGEAFLNRGAARRLFGLLGTAGLSPSVGLFIALIFAVILLTLLLKLGVSLGTAKVSDRLMADLREAAFDRIVHSHLFYFYSSSSAALNQTLENEVEYVGQALNFLLVLLASALSLAVYMAILLAVSWRLTGLVALIGALRYGVSGLFIRRARGLGAEHGELHTKLKSTLTALHQGIDVVKAFGAELRESAAFRRLSGRIRDNADRLAAAQSGNAFFEGLLGDGLLCVIVYAAVSRLHVSGAALLTFLFVITRIIPKVTAINDARIRVAEYLSRVQHLPRALADDGLPVLRWGSTPKPAFEDRVVFERVSFHYPGGSVPSLQEIDLTLRKGETLALVGESGAGKSTLARILLRLFDPTSGRVTVDGLPLPELRREDWTRLVSVVSQDTFIFDDTLENNVKYGAPSASEADFRAALRRARAEEFVAALPERQKTGLGERGVKLSGGQRQRIAIARAFLRDAPILILDEATSAMDAATERDIQAAVAELARERTMLVIAHRFTTIRDADRIVVLDRGRVGESGTHDQLLREGGLYRRYHDLQVK